MTFSMRPFTSILPTTGLLILVSCSSLPPKQDAGAPASPGKRISPQPTPTLGTFAIDLATTLKLAAGRNLELASAIEQANRAAARKDRAFLSIVPDLAVGASFARRNGLLQDIQGTPLRTTNVNQSLGLGNNIGVPGLGLDLSLSRAIYAPLATRQDYRAAQADIEARQNEVLAEAAAAYYELVRARAQVQLAREIEGAAGRLARSTRHFAEAGEGLDADAERAAATHLLRSGQTARAEANLIRRSTVLARLLHLPVSLTLIPTDRSVAATDLVNPDEPVARMVATALKFRPETRRLQAEVFAASYRLQEEKVKPFLPNVAATYSDYRFAAGQGESIDDRGPRDEITAMIYWKLEGLGFGNAAKAREKQAELRMAELREARLLDNIASEVAGYRADVHAQRTRLGIGSKAAGHAKKSYELTSARLEEAQGLPIEALDSIRTLAEARQAEVDAVIDYNIAQHRLLAALGNPVSK
jgi:outer membrane protein TolC